MDKSHKLINRWYGQIHDSWGWETNPLNFIIWTNFPKDRETFLCRPLHTYYLHEGFDSLQFLHLDVDHLLRASRHQILKHEAPISAESARHLAENLVGAKHFRLFVLDEITRVAAVSLLQVVHSLQAVQELQCNFVCDQVVPLPQVVNSLQGTTV